MSGDPALELAAGLGENRFGMKAVLGEGGAAAALNELRLAGDFMGSSETDGERPTDDERDTCSFKITWKESG